MAMCKVRPRHWVAAGEKRLAALEGREPRQQTAWVVDHELYDPVRREWVRKLRTFPTKKEAEAWRDENVRDIKAKKLTATKITVAQAAQRWIEAVTHGRKDKGPAETSTLRQYNYLANTYVIPHLGGIKLTDLSQADVADFRKHLLNKVSRSLARKCLMALKGILSEAMFQGLVTSNVATLVQVGKDNAEEEKVVVPEVAEVRAILAELDRRAIPGPKGRMWRRYRVMIALAIHTGMRAGEIRGLPWTAVDLQEARVHVWQRADEGGKVAKTTKSKAGYRSIPIPADLVQMLREWKLEAGSHALVFATKTGKPEFLSNITRRAWFPVQLAAGITTPVLDENGEAVHKDGKPPVEPRHNFHRLRHFHASMLINDGANPKDVQVEMGHADIQMTYNVYGHLFNDKDSNRRRSERSERLASLLS